MENLRCAVPWYVQYVLPSSAVSINNAFVSGGAKKYELQKIVLAIRRRPRTRGGVAVINFSPRLQNLAYSVVQNFAVKVPNYKLTGLIEGSRSLYLYYFT